MGADSSQWPDITSSARGFFFGTVRMERKYSASWSSSSGSPNGVSINGQGPPPWRHKDDRHAVRMMCVIIVGAVYDRALPRINKDARSQTAPTISLLHQIQKLPALSRARPASSRPVARMTPGADVMCCVPACISRNRR